MFPGPPACCPFEPWTPATPPRGASARPSGEAETGTLITFLGTPGTQAEGAGLGACRAVAWEVGLSPRACFLLTLAHPHLRGPFRIAGNILLGPQDHACCQGSAVPAECPIHCPTAQQPGASYPPCPLLPALPHLPSKATGETPVPLSSQHKGLPHDPPQASPDIQQGQASSVRPMGAPACGAAGTTTASPHHPGHTSSLSRHTVAK